MTTDGGESVSQLRSVFCRCSRDRTLHRTDVLRLEVGSHTRSQGELPLVRQFGGHLTTRQLVVTTAEFFSRTVAGRLTTYTAIEGWVQVLPELNVFVPIILAGEVSDGRTWTS